MGNAQLSFKPFAATVVIILLLRFLLFSTTGPWLFFESLISNSQYLTVGRQKGIIQMKAYADVKKESKYLAFGNSQTGFIYYDTASLKKYNIEVFQLPGLQVHEYNVYTNALENYDTEKVLLFLSDIDMACDPNMERVKYGPAKMKDIFRMKRIFEENAYKYERRDLVDLVVGYFLPEYKYAYVFKAIVKDLYLAPKKPFNRDVNKRSTKKMIERTIKQMNRRKNNRFEEKNIDFSMSELGLFLDYCASRGWEVFIIEGQYINEAYEVRPEYRSKVNDSILKGIADRDRVHFISRDSILLLQSSDFKDNVHIYGDVSPRIIESIINRVENN